MIANAIPSWLLEVLILMSRLLENAIAGQKSYHYPIDTFIITPRQREIAHPLRIIFSEMYFPQQKKRAMIPYGTLIRDGLADFIGNRFVYLG